MAKKKTMTMGIEKAAADQEIQSKNPAITVAIVIPRTIPRAN